jgi:proteic killer suppression protein
MEIKFEKEYLSELYYEGKCSDKKHRFQPHIVKKYSKCIDLLESVP